VWQLPGPRSSRRELRRAVQPRALPVNATRMNAYPNPNGRLAPRFPMIARAVPRERIVAQRPTLWAEPVTINSRSSVSARIAGSCGFVATPPLFRHYARFGALYHIMHLSVDYDLKT
jgi:hypothetical protein